MPNDDLPSDSRQASDSGAPSKPQAAVSLPDGTEAVYPPSDVSNSEPDVSDIQRYEIGAIQPGGLRAARDRILDRAVLVCVADGAEADKLAREARFVARLSHSGVPPVLDFVHGGRASVMVLDRFDGLTLAEAIGGAQAGNVRPELADTTAVILMFTKICDALAAAHARGVVHRAISPVAIQLGSFGQVVIGNWQAAMTGNERPMTQRFIASSASSPSAKESQSLDDLHADVRGVGACLFEALAFRSPARLADDMLGPVTAAERKRIPAPLEGIIRHALGSDKATGYRGMAEFGQDLARFLSNEQLAGYDPGLGNRLGIWIYGRRKRLIAAVLAVVLVGVAVFVVREHLHRINRWGKPIVIETFSDESWRERWAETPAGCFDSTDGRLVSRSPRSARLVYRQRLTTPVAIEYTGQILPKARPGDLSVWWSEHEGVLTDPDRLGGDKRTTRVYQIQAGAWENSWCAIFQQPDNRRVAFSDKRLELGRDYRFRIEIEDNRISMRIDGELVMEYKDLFPATSGYLALYGFFPGKAFDNVQIWRQKVASLVSPVAMGDSLFQFGRYAEAASVYAGLSEAYPEQQIGEQSQFRKGLSERRLGRKDLSRATWARLTDPYLMQLAACLRLQDLVDIWQLDILAETFTKLYQDDERVRPELRQQWQRILRSVLADLRHNEQDVKQILGLRDLLFRDDGATAWDTGWAMIEIGQAAEVLRRFPGERECCANALLALGRTDELIAAPWSLKVHHAQAYIAQGEYAKAIATPEAGKELQANAQCKLGLAEAALNESNEDFPALLYLGRGQQLLEGRPKSSWNRINDTLLALGRYEEGAGAGLPNVDNTGKDWRAAVMLGRLDAAEQLKGAVIPWARLLVAAEAGNSDAVARWRSQTMLPLSLATGRRWFSGVVIAPFTDHLAGDAAALPKALEQAIVTYPRVFGRQAWFFARYVLGHCDEAEMLTLPAVVERSAWLTLGDAVRAELAGRSDEALVAYRAFAALPVQQRLLCENTPDIEVEMFVAWRLRALALAPGK
jgi:hypothetical protein